MLMMIIVKWFKLNLRRRKRADQRRRQRRRRRTEFISCTVLGNFASFKGNGWLWLEMIARSETLDFD